MNIQDNLKRANLLADKIGFEEIWKIEVSEYGLAIYAYENMGVKEILKGLKFEEEYQRLWQRLPIKKFGVPTGDYIYNVHILLTKD